MMSWKQLQLVQHAPNSTAPVNQSAFAGPHQISRQGHLAFATCIVCVVTFPYSAASGNLRTSMRRSSLCKRVLLQLYTQDFYRDVVEPKLKPDGIFVTQSGPAGVLSSTEVFTAIYSTLHSVFPSVLPYAQHIPSYNDAWVRICSHAVCTACFHIV